METSTTVTIEDSDKKRRRQQQQPEVNFLPGGYRPTGMTSFTLIRRPGSDLDDRMRDQLQHKHHGNISENPFYKKTVQLDVLKKKMRKLERQIKALLIMLGEKTEEDDLYEVELEILKSKYAKRNKLQKEFDERSAELRKSLYGEPNHDRRHR